MVIGDLENITDKTVIYLGSHNMSPGAWGTFETSSKFQVTNYEIGVVYEPKVGSAALK
jgi:hypothetical protein